MPLVNQLHAALKRVQPYVDLLPTGAAVEVLAAIDAYEAQTRSKEPCAHSITINGACRQCGEGV